MSEHTPTPGPHDAAGPEPAQSYASAPEAEPQPVPEAGRAPEVGTGLGPAPEVEPAPEVGTGADAAAVAPMAGPGFGPAPVTVPEAGPAAAPPARSRRGVALAAVAALVAVAAGGGVGYAVLHRGGSARADRPAAATPWTAPTPTATKAFGARSGGSHYGSVRLLLLPVPDDYGPGPDVRTYGNDAALDVAQATALLKGDGTDTLKMTAKERKNVDASIAGMHIEGGGVRTYTSSDSRLVVEMTIVQMRNQRVAHSESQLFGELTRAMGVFRNGPRIAGHPQATCVLPPRDPGEKLDAMLCQATEGDLLVKMRAEGVAPLDKASAADLLRRQLDRIQDPGESV